MLNFEMPDWRVRSLEFERGLALLAMPNTLTRSEQVKYLFNFFERQGLDLRINVVVNAEGLLLSVEIHALLGEVRTHWVKPDEQLYSTEITDEAIDDIIVCCFEILEMKVKGQDRMRARLLNNQNILK